ncbi:MAG TPA: alpha/beta fold hydrolase [Gemmatimonadaceae bacterium]|nr:alpha/beta fold hydrolase [Gemmatimonadaceae bacterium]
MLSRPLRVWLSLFVASSLRAQTADVCAGPQIQSVRATQRYDRVDGPSFDFKYRYIPSRADSLRAPTIIVLPGGPGQAGIPNPEGAFPLGAIPADYNRIYTDPRGAGCNAAVAQTDSTALRTDFLARDVLAIIRARGLTRYVIYGASYGTVLATTTAHAIEQDGLPKPIAVVLEGIVGHAFPSFASYMQQFTDEWDRVRAGLPGDWSTRVAATPPPMGYSAEAWGSFAFATIILGDIPDAPIGGPYIHYLLGVLDRNAAAKGQGAPLSTGDSTAMRYIDSRMAVFGSGVLFRAIGCTELWGDWRTGRVIRDGRLEAYGDNVCPPGGKTRAFDARAHPITSPIYYFQGPHDPASGLAGAKYHFDVQTRAARTFVLVDGASHAPLTGGLKSCAAIIWTEIVAARPLDTSNLATCKRRATIERKQAGQ